MEKSDEKQLLARIPKHLHREVKARAAMTGRPLAEVVEEALREWLEKQKQDERRSSHG